jgi:integrase
VLRYRNADGRDTQITIGSPPAWNVAAARKHADWLRHQVDSGVDPLAERKSIRGAPTVAELADRFEAEHLIRRRPKTARDYRALLRLYIRPAMGTSKVASVKLSDVERLHRKIATTAPYMANRAAAVLSKMFALAIKWEMRVDNPTRGLERSPEVKRQRFLSPAEIVRLSEVLASHTEKASANVVRLLLLTGARRGEVLSATWDQFDLAVGVWVKPAATTKQRADHRIPLSAPSLQLLTGLKIEADLENERRARHKLPTQRFLFPGKEGNSLSEIKHFWAAVSEKAGITGIRLHDLRHTHASILASLGLSLPIIGALLGHTQPATTARYAHLLDDPLRAATERVGAIVTGAAKVGGEVVPIADGRRA